MKAYPRQIIENMRLNDAAICLRTYHQPEVSDRLPRPPSPACYARYLYIVAARVLCIVHVNYMPFPFEDLVRHFSS